MNFGHLISLFVQSFALFLIRDFKPICGVCSKPEVFFPPSSGNSSAFGGKSALHGASFPLKPAPSPSWSRRSPKKAPRRFLSTAEEVMGLERGNPGKSFGIGEGFGHSWGQTPNSRGQTPNSWGFPALNPNFGGVFSALPSWDPPSPPNLGEIQRIPRF